jgi:hypothetical protein
MEDIRVWYFLPTVLLVCHSPNWWIDIGANIHVYSDISLFYSYQGKGTRALLMGYRSHTRVLGVGVGMVILKFTLGKTVCQLHHKESSYWFSIVSRWLQNCL